MTVGDERETHLASANNSARAVFLAWERLRLLYNAALAAVVLVFDGSHLSDREFLWFLARAAFGANLCFCLGPVAEGFLALLEANRRHARWAAFVLGLLLACLLAFGSLFAWRMRDFD